MINGFLDIQNIVSVTKAMAIELANRNIRVNSESPGTVMTP